MKEDLEQYYNSLVDKDANGAKYYFDITLVNSQGMTNKVVSLAQMGKKATGAALFKSTMQKAEVQKWDSAIVEEYSADGLNVVNKVKFQILGNRKPKNKIRNLPAVGSMPTQSFNGLGAFEDQLGYLGFTNGLAGVIEASARSQANERDLQRANGEVIELKNKIALLEQKCESLKNETENYKERYKEIQDEKKDLERDYKNQIDGLNNKLTIGTLGANALMGFVAKKVNLEGYLSGLVGDDLPQVQQAQVPQTVVDSDFSNFDETSREYLANINAYLKGCTSDQIKQVATIFQFIGLGNSNLVMAVNFCKQAYRQSQNVTQNTEEVSDGSTEV